MAIITAYNGKGHVVTAGNDGILEIKCYKINYLLFPWFST